MDFWKNVKEQAPPFGVPLIIRVESDVTKHPSQAHFWLGRHTVVVGILCRGKGEYPDYWKILADEHNRAFCLSVIRLWAHIPQEWCDG